MKLSYKCGVGLMALMSLYPPVGITVEWTEVASTIILIKKFMPFLLLCQEQIKRFLNSSILENVQQNVGHCTILRNF